MGTKDDLDTQNKKSVKKDDQSTWEEAIESLRKTKRSKSSPDQQISLDIIRDNNRKKRTNELMGNR